MEQTGCHPQNIYQPLEADRGLGVRHTDGSGDTGTDSDGDLNVE